MSRDNKPKAHRHGTEAQSNSRALSGASTGLEVVCARRVMLAIQELAIRVGRNRTAKLHRVPAIPQRLGTPRPFDPQLSSRLLGTRPDVGRVGLSGNHPLPNLPGRRMASSDRRVDRLRQLGGGGSEPLPEPVRARVLPGLSCDCRKAEDTSDGDKQPGACPPQQEIRGDGQEANPCRQQGEKQTVVRQGVRYHGPGPRALPLVAPTRATGLPIEPQHPWLAWFRPLANAHRYDP
jgi:hypothetical protein